MRKEIDSKGSFLGFRYCLIALTGHSYFFIFRFKGVRLINIYYGVRDFGSRPAFWFRLFGKKVVTNVYFENGKLDKSGKYRFFGR